MMKKLHIGFTGFLVGIVLCSLLAAAGASGGISLAEGRSATENENPAADSATAAITSLAENGTPAAHPAAAADADSSPATHSDAKIYFYGQEVEISGQLLVSGGGTETSRLYFPVELLEYMQFQVDWNQEESTVNLTMNGSSMENWHAPAEIPAQTEPGEPATTDERALDIMQRTGNWRYIEAYLPEMTDQGIDAVVACYNSKHMNPVEHKAASDYYN